MSKGFGYKYSGTKGYMRGVIGSLPDDPAILLRNGWSNISHPNQEAAGHMKLREDKTGLIIIFDKKKPGESGFKAQNHYHIFNPNATGYDNYYLDKDGNPVPKRSDESHILPNGGQKR